MAQVQLRDPLGNPLPLMNIRLGRDSETVEQCQWDQFSDDAGNTSFNIPATAPYYQGASSYTLYVNVREVQRRYQAVTASRIPSFERDIVVTVPPAKPLPLHTDGWNIIEADGTPYVQNHATNFLLAQRLMEGQDIGPLWYRGFRGYRVTSLMQVVPKQQGLREFRPENYPGYYQAWDTLRSDAEQRGKRLEVTLCCDTDWMGLSSDYLYRHAMQMFEIFKGNIHPIEGINEVGHEGNTRDLNIFRDVPAGVFFCVGSSLGGGPCPLYPRNNWFAQHPGRSVNHRYNDLSPIEMITGYQGYAGTGGQVVQNEIIGADEVPHGESRISDPEAFQRMGRMCSAWWGGDFHSTAGVGSFPFGPVTQQCADGWLRGIDGGTDRG